MEQSFQTSFIPKKPMIEERATTSRPFGLLNIIAIFILFAVLLASVGLFFYKGIITGNIAKMQNDLNLAKNRFEPAKIAELHVLDRRLQASSEILGKHITVTPIFEALSLLTMRTVSYTQFKYSFEEAKVVVRMKGVAVGYRSIALQSDLYLQNNNIQDPVFSNLTLDDNGNVLFDLEFSVNPSFVNYKQSLLTQS